MRCTITHSKLKKLKLNKNTLKHALIQCQTSEASAAIVSIHSGITVISLMATVVSDQQVNHDLSERKHVLALSDIRVQLPNSDGNLTLFFAKMANLEILFVFDMHNHKHGDALNSILIAHEVDLNLRSKFKKPRWGENVSLELNSHHLLELPLRSAYENSKFLSASQKAEKISERKRQHGGNAALADAFLKAIKNS